MLVPESVKTSQTSKLDETWAERLALLRYGQLKIDFINETDTAKLELWLEMFGISAEVLQQGLSTEEYRKLLQSVISIYRLSGTLKSVELIGQVLGANEVNISYKYILRHNGEATYNGEYLFDAGNTFKVFAITIEVTGIDQLKEASFSEKLRRLFDLFEPMWIYLEKIEFK